jgi:hypothetical protein
LSVPEALREVGLTTAEPPRRPVVERETTAVILLAVLGEDGTSTWQGLLVGPSGERAVGRRAPPSELGKRAGLSGPTPPLVDLLVAASISYLEQFERWGRELDELESRTEHPDTEQLSRIQRGLLRAHRHLVRLERLLGELGGPLGGRFPGIATVVPSIATDVARTGDVASGLLQSVRDLSVLRTAIDANRLALAANDLGRTSNAIAALANNSNVRMLGVAYVALVIALVSVVVLVPNTAATILGMPSAAWVPGIDVDVVLVVLAIVPIVVVFSRPWVRRMLGHARAYEARSAEGLSDLPEFPPAEAGRPGAAERLIREHP